MYKSKLLRFINNICDYVAENAPETDRRDLLSELEIIKQLKPHPHVIKLLGCVTESGINSGLKPYKKWCSILKYLSTLFYWALSSCC